MSTQHDSELARFHAFIGQRLTKNQSISPEEALDLWRAQHPDIGESEESVEAIRQAIVDMEAGDIGQPFEEVIAELRRRHNLPPRS